MGGDLFTLKKIPTSVVNVNFRGHLAGKRQTSCLYFNLTIGISRKAAKSLSFSLRLGVFAREFK
jgi:hypothetical protein